MGDMICFAHVVTGRAGNRAHLSQFPGLAFDRMGGKGEESGCLLLGRVVRAVPQSPTCSPNRGRLLERCQSRVEDRALGLPLDAESVRFKPGRG